MALFPGWEGEVFLRYQHPVIIGDAFEMSPNFAIDGSVGVIRQLGRRYQLGAYWHGQWHDYDYSTVEAFGQNPVSGTQSTFFSKVELRFGVMF